MEAHKQSQVKAEAGSSNPIVGALPFFFGLALSLALGWWVFPDSLFSKETQPINFSHKVHTENVGMECSSCHYYREDGSFHGLPTTQECAECHMEAMDWSEDEVAFVRDYVELDKEVDWKVYQYQPDNVFFSHAAHSMDNCGMCHDITEAELCSYGGCHPNVAETDTAPPVQKNRITGYSKDTMKMWQCEKCHTLPEHYEMTGSAKGQACFSCHK